MSPQDNLSPQESRAVFWRVKARALTSPLTILRLILVATLATAGWFLAKSIVGQEGTLLGFIITAIAAEFLNWRTTNYYS